MKNFVSSKVESLHFWADALAMLESSTAPMERRASAAKAIFGDDPSFWLEVVEMVSPSLGATTAPVAKPVVTTSTPAPATKPVAPTTTATMPARTLQAEPDSEFKTWKGLLTGVVNNRTAVSWKYLQSLTVEVFTSGTKLSRPNWELLFSAMKIANDNGNHIVNNDAQPFEIFSSAPLELVDDYLFGQDGIVPSLTGEVSDSAGKMPPWLSAKCSVCFDAVEAVDVAQGLDEQEERLVINLLDAIKAKNGLRRLIEKGEGIMGSLALPEGLKPATDKIGNGGSNVHIIGDLQSVVRPSVN